MSLYIELPVGLQFEDKLTKEVELLPTNGVAEKVFTKKIADKPYTWQGNVLSVAIKRIGDILIGVKCREEYLDNHSVTIPEAIKNLTLGDVNTLLVEIHRKCWDSTLKKQEFICKYCTTKLVNDIDLNRISFSQEEVEFMATNPDYSKINVYLKTGFKVEDIKELNREDYSHFKGLVFNKIVYRPPLLKDAILNERFASDTIDFWRRIAFDCCLEFQAVENADTPDEKVIEVLPPNAINFAGLKLYDLYLDGKDLKAIREELIEYIPTLPFYYTDACPTCGQETPYVMEASTFFSA